MTLGAEQTGVSDLQWYINRLTRMSPAEIRGRAVDQIHKQIWRRRWVRPGLVPGAAPPQKARGSSPSFTAALPPGTIDRMPPAAKQQILATADQILCGRLEVLGTVRSDLVAPDWFRDPLTGRRAPAVEYCFSIDHRSEDVTGNVKQVWELSRHQHTTVLAAAYAITGDESYALRAASHLRSWWQANPFLSGVHWTSGIEVGLRLISWVWIRRLLDGWSGAPALFEANPMARRQIWWHQSYLSRFRSRGSSANNHAIAEATGQLVASLAFGWFDESPCWARESRDALGRHLRANTFPSGLNREMAFEYHGFVTELGLVALAEAEFARAPLDAVTTELLCRMLDAGVATLDATGRGPRYGDGDGGRVLPLGSPARGQWGALVAMGAAIFGPVDWWPRSDDDPAAVLLSAMTRRGHSGPVGRLGNGNRPARRPWHVDDAGLTILRTDDGRPEIWCRGDAGPHGFLSIAAHGHADALSIEVRHGGIDVLADPGTYCYHGDRSWRDYFRSTLGHNTIEVADRDQSTSAGPFMWSRHAESTLKVAAFVPGEDKYVWSAEQHGYEAPPIGVRHARSVTLMAKQRRIEILDELSGRSNVPFRLAFHFGPDVAVDLRHDRAVLDWTSAAGRPTGATMDLPPGLSWTLWQGAEAPMRGWYAPSFGRRVEAPTLIGEGATSALSRMLTSLQFTD